MNRKIVILGTLAIAASCYSLFFAPKKSKEQLVTINKFADHPALNSAADGVKSALQKRYPSIKIDEQDSQGSATNAFQIAKHQASSNPLAMVGIATPSAQSLLKARNNNKVILSFAAVTDPKAANLEEAANVVGVTDRPPVEKLVEITAKIFPNKKRIGTIFNPGEINSINTIERLKKACEPFGITVVEAPVNSSSNIKIATQKLVTEVDIIYIPQDNMVVSSIDAVIQITNANNAPVVDNIPIISNDDTYLKKGVFIALGTNYFDSGVKLGNMIADQIEKKSTANNIQDADANELQINYELLEKFGIDKKAVEGIK